MALSMQEIKLIGEFVDSTVAAGFVKSIQGCVGVSQIATMLQREAANEAAVEKSRQDAARTELKRLANLGAGYEQAEKANIASGWKSGRQTESDLGLPSDLAKSENGEMDFPRTA